jgi:hypothetical protein
MKRLLSLAAVVLCIFVAGCSTYAVNRYSISVDNVVTLREYRGTVKSIGEFTSTKPKLTSLSCRMVGPIETPDKTTFAEYIRQAFVDEFQIAEAFSDSSQTVLTGNLDDISFSSTSGTWDMTLTISSNNSTSFTVPISYDYSSSFFGETACNQTAQALLPAVQELIKATILHEEFSSLLRPAR